eukprot:1048831-Pelagomonas_calceolata.AAC.4
MSELRACPLHSMIGAASQMLLFGPKPGADCDLACWTLRRCCTQKNGIHRLLLIDVWPHEVTLC